jgi:hypothetical protein
MVHCHHGALLWHALRSAALVAPHREAHHGMGEKGMLALFSTAIIV